MTTLNNKIDMDTTKGIVSGKWIDSSGHEIALEPRHNQMSFSAADSLACAYGGDPSKIPNRIGFIYGTQQAPTDLTPPSRRDQSWENLSEELSGVGGNILISDFSYDPTISIDMDGRDATYEGNSVTFHGVTRSGSSGKYGFPTAGGSYASVFADGMYIYHAVLLSENPSGTYKILARVSLASDGGTFRQKPSDYELSLDWRVSFY